MREFVVLTAIATLTTLGCVNPAPEAGDGPPPTIELAPVAYGTAPPNPYSDEQIERGRVLVSFGSCNDCHTPWLFDPEMGAPMPQMDRMLSGHPREAPDPIGTLAPGDIAVIGPTFTSFALPFGIVYSLNLTPDMDTGSGTWTEEMFLDIFRTAKHLGGDGRPVLPPMPWNWVAHVPDEDLIAIFAYLRSIPPVRNAVPSAKVPEEVLPFIDEMNQKILQALPAVSR